MKVHLKRDFNAPGDNFFASRNSPVTMGEDMLPYLPSDAVIDGSSRDETRRKVLLARKELKLDEPNKGSGEIDFNKASRLTSDADLLAKAESKAPAKAKTEE